MFAMQETARAQERKSARKELRMKPSDDARIRAAAASVGLSEADFMTQAALLHAADIERRSFHSILPAHQFAAFQEAVTSPGRASSGLTAAAKDVDGILKDA